jgi:hypothetical protein
MRVNVNFLIEGHFKVDGIWLHNADLKNIGYRQKLAPNSWAALTFYT